MEHQRAAAAPLPPVTPSAAFSGEGGLPGLLAYLLSQERYDEASKCKSHVDAAGKLEATQAALRRAADSFAILVSD